MRLVDPVRGFVVETTDPQTIAILLYGRGYWNADPDSEPATGTPALVAPGEYVIPSGKPDIE